MTMAQLFLAQDHFRKLLYSKEGINRFLGRFVWLCSVIGLSSLYIFKSSEVLPLDSSEHRW